MSVLTLQLLQEGNKTNLVFDSKRATFSWKIDGAFLVITQDKKISVFPSHTVLWATEER